MPQLNLDITWPDQKGFFYVVFTSFNNWAGLLNWHTAMVGLLSTPYPSVLYFWKITFEKSSSMNWIFNLKKWISKLIFAGYTGSKNLVWKWLKIEFVKLDFPTWFFKKQVQMDRTSNSALNANAEIQVFNGI